MLRLLGEFYIRLETVQWLLLCHRVDWQFNKRSQKSVQCAAKFFGDCDTGYFATSKRVATLRKLAPPANLHKAIATRLAGRIAFRSLVFLLEISGETRLTNRRNVSICILKCSFQKRDWLSPSSINSNQPKRGRRSVHGHSVGILCRNIYATFISAKLVDVAVGRVCNNKPHCRNKSNLLFFAL